MSDLISRQDAIDKVSEYASVWMSYTDGMSKEEIAQEALNSAKDTMIRIISELPSAQTEPLTDKEQRIFLAAMGREEKVCKQVDEECRDCREPYEDSLVRTCHEIERKVKGALWT